MPTARQIFAVVAAGRLAELQKTAAAQPETYVVVICDLTGAIGRKIAEIYNQKNYKNRKPNDDIWTFTMPLVLWQKLRIKTVGSEDTFTPPENRFVVVTDAEVLTGGSLQINSNVDGGHTRAQPFSSNPEWN